MSATKSQFTLKGVPVPQDGITPEGMVILNINGKHLMVTKDHYDEYKAHLEKNKSTAEVKDKDSRPISGVHQPQPQTTAPNQNEQTSMLSNAKGMADEVVKKTAIGVMGGLVSNAVVSSVKGSMLSRILGLNSQDVGLKL